MNTIEELKKDEKLLEKDILKLIKDFEDKYLCYLTHINLIHDSYRNMLENELIVNTVGVSVEIRIK